MCAVFLLEVECPRTVFLRGHFGEDALAEGRVLWNAVGDAVVLACVERHAEEEEEHHGHHAKHAVSVGVAALDEEKGEGEDDAAEDEQNRLVHVDDKQIRPNHAQCEGNDEANERVVLPVHQRFFSSLMRASGFSAPNT